MVSDDLPLVLDILDIGADNAVKTEVSEVMVVTYCSSITLQGSAQPPQCDSLDSLSHIVRKVQRCVGQNDVDLHHEVVAGVSCKLPASNSGQVHYTHPMW